MRSENLVHKAPFLTGCRCSLFAVILDNPKIELIIRNRLCILLIWVSCERKTGIPICAFLPIVENRVISRRLVRTAPFYWLYNKPHMFRFRFFICDLGLSDFVKLGSVEVLLLIIFVTRKDAGR